MDNRGRHVSWPIRQYHKTLLTDLHETILLLFQHSILSALLAIQLCSLPLIHALHHVSNDDAAIHEHAIFNRDRPQSRLQPPTALRPARNFWQTLCDIWNGITRVGRIATALYELGTILDHDPRLLRSRAASAAQRSSATRDTDIESTFTSLSARHATASQVYHAALGDDTALDDLLAGFAADGGSGKVSARRRISTASAMDDQRSVKVHKQRNSSILSTSEEMRAPSSKQGTEKETIPPTEPITLIPASPSLAASPRQSVMSGPPNESISNLPTPVIEGGDKLLLHSQVTNLSPRGSVSTSPAVEGCSKEVARQAHAGCRLPKCRSMPVSGEQHSGSVRKRESFVSVETVTPTRTSRLQRRVRSPQT